MHRQRVFNDHSKAMQEIRNEKRGGGARGSWEIGANGITLKEGVTQIG